MPNKKKPPRFFEAAQGPRPKLKAMLTPYLRLAKARREGCQDYAKDSRHRVEAPCNGGINENQESWQFEVDRLGQAF